MRGGDARAGSGKEQLVDWLDSVAGEGYTAAVLWTLAALVALVVVLVIVKIIKSLTAGTFVSGGRNRKTRLAVMDATAVDSHRRLVLVRRDGVEHLLLIGGPNDVVVEGNIPIPAARPAGDAQQRQRPQEQVAHPAQADQAARVAHQAGRQAAAQRQPGYPAASPARAQPAAGAQRAVAGLPHSGGTDEPRPSPEDEMSRLLDEFGHPRRQGS